VIDGEDRLVQVDKGFYRFAAENGWDDSGSSLGRSLWDFVAGEELKKLQRMLIRRVRGEAGDVQLPFRCDSPGARREMDIHIAPSSAGTLVQFKAHLRSEEPREFQPLLDPEADRAEEMIEMCGWCDRFRVGDEWVEVEEAEAVPAQRAAGDQPRGLPRLHRDAGGRLAASLLRFPILPRPMSKVGSPENPLRVAIVGAGPSGFYAAEHILKGEEMHAQVDLFDRLPTPFGLVRGGVAPDHPKIKSVTRVYEKTAARDGFRFFGNVKIGHDIEVEDLERLYHAIVFTVGCETDRQLGVPGEDLPGSAAATAFVGWYNAHPDYADHDFDLSSERAVVIGNGNVAMDVARMLALTDHELRQTDTADHAIELLDAKKIREIVVLGRRGPAQAAFTNPEIRELGEMEDADVIVDPADLELDPASAAYLESDEADKTTRVNVETLREFSQRTPEGKHQRIVLRFLASPIEIKGDGKVESIVIGRNELVEEGGALRAKDTGEREELECGLILRSVGYTGIPIEGVPFDPKRGLILNEGGRVLDSHDSGHKVGHYTAGWIKRGPSGVIGTNKKDALETVTHLLADVESQALLEPENPDPAAVEALLAERGTRYVSFEDWQAIDQAEVGRGEPHGRPRVKFVRVEEMLSTLGESVGS
jgi:ferredoxin/flavodoxin---NADP+ reductase